MDMMEEDHQPTMPHIRRTSINVASVMRNNVTSMPVVPTHIAPPQGKKRRRLSDPTIAESAKEAMRSIKRLDMMDLDQVTSPVEFICAAFDSHGCDSTIRKSVESSLFQHRPSKQEMDAYDLQVVTAVREQNLAKLMEHHKSGKSLQCCNRFGESLIHMACRRGYTQIVKYMVKEAGVSLFVHDDFGRTPFHYACWTPEPSLELLEFLIGEVPDLLLLSDVRSHVPFSYVRKEHWTTWVEFLKQRRHLLRSREEPKELLVVG